MGSHLLASVIRSVIEQPVRVASPVRPLLGQQLSQAREEHQHDVAVRVELRQAQVYVALGVDGSNHVDAVAQALHRHSVPLAPLSPFLVTEVKVGQPRFIYVQYAGPPL